MHLSLDTATLTFFAAILSMCMATLVFNTARDVRILGLEQWGLAMTCASLAFALYFLRGTGPIFLTYVMANGLMLAVTMFGVVAYARVLEVAVPWLAIGPGSVIALSGVLSVSMIGAPSQLGVLFMNLILATHMLVAIQLIVQSSQRQGLRIIWASVTAMSALALTLVTRGVLSTVTDARSLEVSVSALPQVAAFVAGMLVVVVSTVDLLSMANERVSRDAMTIELFINHDITRA